MRIAEVGTSTQKSDQNLSGIEPFKNFIIAALALIVLGVRLCDSSTAVAGGLRRATGAGSAVVALKDRPLWDAKSGGKPAFPTVVCYRDFQNRSGQHNQHQSGRRARPRSFHFNFCKTDRFPTVRNSLILPKNLSIYSICHQVNHLLFLFAEKIFNVCPVRALDPRFIALLWRSVL